jgi:hypothetical protein
MRARAVESVSLLQPHTMSIYVKDAVWSCASSCLPTCKGVPSSCWDMLAYSWRRDTVAAVTCAIAAAGTSRTSVLLLLLAGSAIPRAASRAAHVSAELVWLVAALRRCHVHKTASCT